MTTNNPYTNLIDEKAEPINAAAVNQTPWKNRIIDYLLTKKNHTATIKEVLKATDDKYNEENYSKRKHCLDSQKTYMKQDLNVIAAYQDDTIKLVGVYNPKKNIIQPFKQQ